MAVDSHTCTSVFLSGKLESSENSEIYGSETEAQGEIWTVSGKPVRHDVRPAFWESARKLIEETCEE
jgi:hypothetical protein